MAIVIKEIIVKTTVEQAGQPELQQAVPPDWQEQLNEKIVREVERQLSMKRAHNER